jgi:hypothetical protein
MSVARLAAAGLAVLATAQVALASAAVRRADASAAALRRALLADPGAAARSHCEARAAAATGAACVTTLSWRDDGAFVDVCARRGALADARAFGPRRYYEIRNRCSLAALPLPDRVQVLMR